VTESTTATAIGFVGLGNMGLPMVGRLVAAGHHVRAYDIDAAARDRAAALGATAVAAPADVAPGTGVVVLMLPDSAVVSAVVRDPAFAGSLRPGSVLVDMGSSEPEETRRLAAELAARGVRMVDAPVSGGVTGARAGTLTVMAGGPAEDVAPVQPILAVFGRVLHAGPVGAGHAVKALNNLLSATHLWITCEAISAGQRFGLDPEVMLSVFNTSSGRSGSTETKWPRFILPQTYDSGFGLRLMVKDMRTAVRLADHAGAPSRLGAGAVDLWAEAAAHLDAAADHTEVARWIAHSREPPAATADTSSVESPSDESPSDESPGMTAYSE
jgi:3-hydroxyisobutyrate dehydrogenase